MKKLSILGKMFLLVFCFSFVLLSQGYDLVRNSGSTVNDYLIIPYVDPIDAPYIDGDTTGDVWLFYPPIAMDVYVDQNTPEGKGGAADFSSYFRVLYNEDAIYILVTVVDDSLFNSGANNYEQDCIELYFDGDNSKGGAYDGNDVQWRWVYDWAVDSISPGNADVGYWVWAETDNGYQLELRISQDSLEKAGIQLFYLSVEGDTIGFEVQVSDNDTNVRDFITKWWSESNNSWQNPSLFGTALLGDQDDYPDDAVVLEVVQIDNPPYIDGDTAGDDWDSVPRVRMDVYTDDDLPDGGFAEFSSYFRLAWDADAIYFFGEVYDDSLFNSGTNSWEQDCWELYFDGDNSKGGSYDGNDIQWRWVYGYPADSLGIPGSWADCGYWAWMETPYGYNFELRISDDSLQKSGVQLFSLSEGTVFGFEAQAVDNDTGATGTIDCISKWWSNSGNSWQYPSLFGTARLVFFPGGVAEDDASVNLAAPAVINASTTIEFSTATRSTVKVDLYNLAGQKAATLVSGTLDAGTHTAELDASGLANGVYLLRISACGTNTAKKVLLIK